MHAEPAGLPRSFVADATDIAAVLEARQARLVLGWTTRVFVIGIPALLLTVVCAAMFLPCFIPLPCRSRQSEAKRNLKVLYVEMQSWFTEHDRFSDRFAEIGFEPKGQRLRYRYVVTGAVGGGYRSWAFGVADQVAGDLWVNDQNNRLVNLHTCCGGPR